MRGRMWPWLLLVLAFLPALLIQEPKTKLQPVSSHVFTEAIFQNPNNLDPALASNAADWQVASNIFQTLLDISPTGSIVPGLASSVTYRGNIVTIELRHETLANGVEVTPDMVAEALVRPLVAPVNSQAARSLLSQVVGVKRFEEGKTKYLQGIQVTGPNSLELTLKQPAGPGFLRNLANPALAIVPASDQRQGGDNWQFTNLIGTGGYTLTQWTPDASLSFSKVSGQGPQAVNLIVYSGLSQALLAFQNHLVNAIPLQPDQLKQLTRPELAHVEPLNVPGDLSLYVNTTQKKLALPKISLTRWVHAAFFGRLSPLSRQYPSSIQSKRPQSVSLTVWVNQNNAEAMQLASTLKTIDPHVIIQATTSTNLSQMAHAGKISAYLGIINQFPHGVGIPLVPDVSFWLFSHPVSHAIVMEHDVLSWHSVP
ncbi:MAG: hypothetical protein C7B47_09530 [Sulfobacillus thermosulfidooxidans]|uniref:Solute-binding protein family 5 domain-containing protein n=1 Tax=Sulfobacillus thermosulfidooxidans TaxID=28034 RepID=A0A2T2WXM5_SULTH|nr:MAG: hypothetical protein C7B47_09530 [Sulfobacillus thermosulfidooxidans]